MEMGRHSVVFGILTTVLVFADSKRQCNYQSNCDRSLQFCDEVTGRCTSCGSFPCAESTMKEQGDGWCRKICPGEWRFELPTFLLYLCLGNLCFGWLVIKLGAGVGAYLEPHLYRTFLPHPSSDWLCVFILPPHLI